MARYTVAHRYQACRDGQVLGPWSPGTEVDVPEELAEWVNRDSPDTLAPVVEAAPEPEPELVDDEAARQQPPSPDRQQRRGRNRAS